MVEMDAAEGADPILLMAGYNARYSEAVADFQTCLSARRPFASDDGFKPSGFMRFCERLLRQLRGLRRLQPFNRNPNTHGRGPRLKLLEQLRIALVRCALFRKGQYRRRPVLGREGKVEAAWRPGVEPGSGFPSKCVRNDCRGSA
jgi:hypothetical protein